MQRKSFGLLVCEEKCQSQCTRWCDTMQCNAMQCNAMQRNAMQMRCRMNGQRVCFVLSPSNWSFCLEDSCGLFGLQFVFCCVFVLLFANGVRIWILLLPSPMKPIAKAKAKANAKRSFAIALRLLAEKPTPFLARVQLFWMAIMWSKLLYRLYLFYLKIHKK